MKASHRNTLESIPWMINGRVSEEERRTFEKHLNECAECRNEFAEQARVYAAIAHEKPRVDYAPGGSLQKLWGRIDNAEQYAAPAGMQKMSIGSRSSRLTHWLAAAVVIEAIGITFMAAQGPADSSAGRSPPAYRTVTTTQIVPQNAVLRVVFDAKLPISEVNALLQKQQLMIVDGPSAAGVYTLATSVSTDQLSNTVKTTLTNLRANPSVLFVEPIAVQPVGRAAESRP